MKHEHVELFEVSEPGTVKAHDFDTPTLREHVFDIRFEEVKTKEGLLMNISWCRPLLYAVHRLYWERREQLESELRSVRSAIAADGRDLSEIELELKSMPEEAEGNADKWISRLSDQDFEKYVLKPLEPWFSEEVEWLSEGDHVPNSATAWGYAIDYFDSMDADDLDALGVYIVEGDCPGSSYYAVELENDAETANAIAEERGLACRFVREDSSPALSVVLHIPHSSAEIPADVRRKILLNDEELSNELRVMTDHFTDELFGLERDHIKRAVFPISRIALDPERFEDDALESMSNVGMGVVYTKTHDGKMLRKSPSAKDRANLIERFYKPHHAELEALVDEAILESGHCLLVDCHSFPSQRLPYEPSSSTTRPEICIGTDAFHTPRKLAEIARTVFDELNFEVAMNTPFSGALVPMSRYQSDDRVSALMVEVRRDLYMDEASGKKSEGFEWVGNRIYLALSELIGRYRPSGN